MLFLEPPQTANDQYEPAIKACPAKCSRRTDQKTFQRHEMLTLPDYPGLSRIQTESPPIP